MDKVRRVYVSGSTFRAGRVDQVVGLQTTEYLLKETEYLPWEAASVNLGFIEDMLAHSDSYGLFEVCLPKFLFLLLYINV